MRRWNEKKKKTIKLQFNGLEGYCCLFECLKDFIHRFDLPYPHLDFSSGTHDV